MHLKRLFSFVAAFAAVALSIGSVSFAAADVSVLEQRVTADSVVLYVKHTVDEEAAARIGMYDVSESTVIDDSFPIVTWLLVDNSISIEKEDREAAKNFLGDIIAAKAPDERFNLCTISEGLHPLVMNSDDETELMANIDAITYQNQNTYLTNALSELIDEEEARLTTDYVRVFVISDGVDNNPEGITREELETRLKQITIPVYSVGCKGKAQELKEMYALSRQTGARYWPLSDWTGAGEAEAVLLEEMPLCVNIPIPEQLRDGTAKAVRLTFHDGSYAQTQVEMPLADNAQPLPAIAQEPAVQPEQEDASAQETETQPEEEAIQTTEPEEEPTKALTPEEPAQAPVPEQAFEAEDPALLGTENESDPLLGKKAIAAVLILFAGAFFLIRRRKGAGDTKQAKKKADPVGAPRPARQKKSKSAPAQDMALNMGGGEGISNKTVYMGSTRDIGSGTVYAGSSIPGAGVQAHEQAPKMMISLRDVNRPEMTFELAATQKKDFVTSSSYYEVKIGRAADNDIVIDYDQTISAHHCKITFGKPDALVYDLQSKNGTCVNKMPVMGNEPRTINSGSLLQLGEAVFHLEFKQQADNFSVPTLW